MWPLHNAVTLKQHYANQRGGLNTEGSLGLPWEHLIKPRKYTCLGPAMSRRTTHGEKYLLSNAIRSHSHCILFIMHRMGFHMTSQLSTRSGIIYCQTRFGTGKKNNRQMYRIIHVASVQQIVFGPSHSWSRTAECTCHIWRGPGKFVKYIRQILFDQPYLLHPLLLSYLLSFLAASHIFFSFL